LLRIIKIQRPFENNNFGNPGPIGKKRLGYKDDNFKYGHSELDFERLQRVLLLYTPIKRYI